MRLRQIAFIAHELDPIAEQLDAVFDLKVGFRDPAVEYFGLNNIVMPVGGEFLEVVSPFRDDASGARYLARRGGNAGYMVILQEADAFAHRERLEKAGVRVIARSPKGAYRYTHFHPGDCTGVLMSIDSVEATQAGASAGATGRRRGPSGARIRATRRSALLRSPSSRATRWRRASAGPSSCSSRRAAKRWRLRWSAASSVSWRRSTTTAPAWSASTSR